MDNRRFNNESAVADFRQGYGTAVDSSTAANVLKNTYWLLGMTLAFSAFTAFLSSSMPFNAIVHYGAFFGALAISFVIQRVANSVWGLVLAFAFTGLLGLTIGPIVGQLIAGGAAQAVTSALGLTAFVFFGLSAYALISKKDFSFLAGFLVAGFWVIVGCIIMSFFIQSSAFSLAISGAIVLFASAGILYQTSEIVHGGETNYILAAVSLYASIYNLFISLLNLILAFGGDD
ncbi:Bax inhibitor-1/YccA family protein [Hahella sp. CR1]|uniref:Bax inhibitor-1/YccA family protein n=1 Tax=unclassified Hahella TaxID=2624107 RepID=UPI0024427B7E|nr:Bax inhibitor-1/YccA family protein [Hahella sp. CR1]MDG9671872.1 Bax inhibitor-1/YccA family protein [Hahella sp. CR1]